jgi:hypothetical protein
MGSMRNWMLGAAILAGTVGLGATAAQAAEFGVHVSGPFTYVPPSPGAGYDWVAGYQSNGYWIQGRWNFAGNRDRDRDQYVRVDRGFDRGRDVRGRDFDRGRDSNRHADQGRGHERFRR